MRFRSAWLEMTVAAPLIAAFVTSGCSNGSGAAPIVPGVADRSFSFDAMPGKYIKHIVVLVQENRSFDNLFATFPGADGATRGETHDGKRGDGLQQRVPLARRAHTTHLRRHFIQ